MEFEFDVVEEGPDVLVLARFPDGDLDPKDDLRGLVSGIPKRLCKRRRVEVGCFEVAAESDEDATIASGGGYEDDWGRGGGEEGALVVLVRSSKSISEPRSILELVEAGLPAPFLPMPIAPELPYFIPLDRAILVCVGVTRLVIVEWVPVVAELNGLLWLRVTGFEPLP